MKIIDKYVYNSLVLPTVFGISIFTFILMINALIEVMEKLFANDLPLLTVLDYFLYIVLTIFSMPYMQRTGKLIYS